MNDYKNTIEINGESYDLYFNLNVMKDIQDKFGSISEWGNLIHQDDEHEPSIEALISGFYFMLNEGVEIYNDENSNKRDFFTLKQVGRIISKIGINEMSGKLAETVIGSTEQEEKK